MKKSEIIIGLGIIGLGAYFYNKKNKNSTSIDSLIDGGLDTQETAVTPESNEPTQVFGGALPPLGTSTISPSPIDVVNKPTPVPVTPVLVKPMPVPVTPVVVKPTPVPVIPVTVKPTPVPVTPVVVKPTPVPVAPVLVKPMPFPVTPIILPKTIPVTPVDVKPTPVPVIPVIIPTPLAVKNYYSYKYGAAQTGGTIYWTNKDGSSGSAYVSQGGYYNIPCMLENSGSGFGQWTKGSLCSGSSIISQNPIDIIVKPTPIPVTPVIIPKVVTAPVVVPKATVPTSSIISQNPIDIIFKPTPIPVTPVIIPKVVTAPVVPVVVPKATAPTSSASTPRVVIASPKASLSYMR